MNLNDVVNPIYQAADQSVTLKVKDSTGAAYDLSGASKLVVALYYLDKTILAKYSMNVGAGYKTLDMTNAATGQLALKIETVDTITAQEGKVYAEIRAQLPDVTYEDSQYDLIGEGIYIGEVVKSITSTLTLP